MAGINPDTWESAADSHESWRVTVSSDVQKAETSRDDQLVDKRGNWKTRTTSAKAPFSFICSICTRDCLSRVGLYCHSRKCSSQWTELTSTASSPEINGCREYFRQWPYWRFFTYSVRSIFSFQLKIRQKLTLKAY